MVQMKFIDLFAGIGGFHYALHKEGAVCVASAEIDTAARKTYEANFKTINPELFSNNLFYENVTTVDEKHLPDFDLLCAGFPCQSFSNMGHGKGFDDTRGTLFFDVVRILKEKKPKVIILENVRGLLTNNSGKTFKVIQKSLDKLGYNIFYKVLRAKDYGVPQERPRLYIVGFLDSTINFKFPLPTKLKLTMSDIFGKKCNKVVGYTLRVGGRKSPFGDRHAWDQYLVNGKQTTLMPEQAKLMQGFPKSFKLPVTETQAMKQLGNSVAIPVVRAIYKEIKKYVS